MLTGKTDKTGYTCPYCNKHNDVNEGCSEAFEGGVVLVYCVYCDKESVSDEEV
jgi:hypothetical protein